MKLINTLTDEIMIVSRRGCDYRIEMPNSDCGITMTMNEKQFLALTFKPEIQEVKEPDAPAHSFLRLEWLPKK